MNSNTIINKSYHNNLLIAYNNGDIDQFKILIDNKAMINCRMDDNRSLISHVISNPNNNPNNKEFFDLLISKGADLDDNGTSQGLLSAAVFSQNDIYYARKLLENNVNVNSCGRYTVPHDHMFNYFHPNGTKPYGPPIFDALFLGNLDYVNLFSEYGFDVNICDHNNKSVIEYFITNCSCRFDKSKSEKIFKMLINYGADLDMPFSTGTNILGAIIKSKQYHLLEILFEKYPDVNVNYKNSQGTTPIMNAIENHNIHVVKFLIKKGADLNCLDKNDNNPVFLAARYDNMDIFKLLINSGADLLCLYKNNNNTILHKLIDFENKFVSSPYNHVCFNDYYKIIIKKHQQLLSTKNKNGQTPIDIAKNQKQFLNKFQLKIKNELKQTKLR